MNILHVLSQFEVTGAEVYAATLAAEQLKRGHRIYLVSDTLTVPVQGIFIQQPIGKRSYPQRIKNISFLIDLIRNKRIDVVHAHSRAASWVSHFAALVTRTPFISTVHGRQHLHRSTRAFSVYGDRVIVVSESLRGHLIDDLGLNAHKISYIPNGFDFQQQNKPPSNRSKSDLFGIPDQTKLVLFVGRLSGPKGDVVRFLISEILPDVSKATPCSLQIIGGLTIPEDIAHTVEATQRRLGKSSVGLIGFQRNIAPYLSVADVVIGAGRVAIESLADGKPTIAFGESQYVGPVTESNFVEAMQTNFGDTGLRQQVSKKIIVQDLVRALGTEPRNVIPNLQKLVRQHFDITVVEERVRRVYEQAIVSKRSPFSIPVLMYHRIVVEPPAASRHGIWVTALEFEHQLHSLKKRGLTPLTFEQYRSFMRGDSSLPSKPVILTFDDGYEDNYTTAYPILQRYGFPAVIYLVTDSVHRTNFWDADEPRVPLMTSEQIREMSRYGIEFGSHTVSHVRLPEISLAEAQKEILESKSTLESLLGKEVISFAYPYGALSYPVKNIVAESGYSFAVAADSGPLTFQGDLYEIRRTQVFPWTRAFGFWKKTHPRYSQYKSINA